MKYNSKVDLVYKAILDGVKKGDYLPGDRIVISRVAKENGCSEIPVREALRRLESEKIVELVPNKGAVVTQVSKSFLEQLFVVKAILGGRRCASWWTTSPMRSWQSCAIWPKKCARPLSRET